MTSNVIINALKCNTNGPQSNKTDKCYPNRIYWKERRPQYRSDKISAAALFQKTQHPIAFNRKNVTPHKLYSFKSKRNKHRGALSQNAMFHCI